MADDSFLILAVAGSLRRHSYNRGLVRASIELAPQGTRIEPYDIGSIPPYNGDIEAAGDPEPVLDFKRHIRAANALLIATPEYNYGIPGVLKNAIDWASRPPTDSALWRKPLAIVGASSGRGATIRAQLALRQTFLFTESYALLKPELAIAQAAQYFDSEGNLHDENIRELLKGVIMALVDWAHLVRPG